jgi:cyclopropane fatty-acyl-phospholipid synthase-like methyltransferase
MLRTATTPIQPHNTRPAAVWSAGGAGYDEISHGISDALEHCVRRLAPQPGERVLDLATGTGWTSRLVARRGAVVDGVDIAEGLLASARARAAAEGPTTSAMLKPCRSTTPRSTLSCRRSV